jgi:hypothetical protein
LPRKIVKHIRCDSRRRTRREIEAVAVAVEVEGVEAKAVAVGEGVGEEEGGYVAVLDRDGEEAETVVTAGESDAI